MHLMLRKSRAENFLGQRISLALFRGGILPAFSGACLKGLLDLIYFSCKLLLGDFLILFITLSVFCSIINFDKFMCVIM